MSIFKISEPASDESRHVKDYRRREAIEIYLKERKAHRLCAPISSQPQPHSSKDAFSRICLLPMPPLYIKYAVTSFCFSSYHHRYRHENVLSNAFKCLVLIFEKEIRLPRAIFIAFRQVI